MPYRFRVGDDSWSSQDFTLDEMCDVESGLGVKWTRLDPVTEVLPQRAMIAQWFRRTMSAEEALKRAGALRQNQIQVDEVDDDRPEQYADGLPVIDPKAARDEPATTWLSP